ncbi:hypothetical protein SAMN05414137_12010 [Streptacidiphilus jiangxiensis]|uniref:Uncharacterized protein n=1 Tax=Streptacidiphilus jiangxiensis TaxID=235985 RepID=A0A1H7W8W5_STRJI|nr:hypothetical protein SAMN05414137_12010 [Streptacidiphilus jiangxiensis]
MSVGVPRITEGIASITQPCERHNPWRRSVGGTREMGTEYVDSSRTSAVPGASRAARPAATDTPPMNEVLAASTGLVNRARDYMVTSGQWR